MSDRDFLNLATIILFEVRIEIAACFDSGVEDMERKSSDRNARW